MFDRVGIAERLRGLLGGQDGGDISATADRLGIEEVSLRMSIDELSPHPTIEVLAAVVQTYGIDPNWLLTGRYDAMTHRLAMEQGNVESTLRQLIGTPRPRIAEPPYESFRLNDHN